MGLPRVVIHFDIDGIFLDVYQIKLLGYPHLWKLRMLEYSLIMSSVYSNDNGTSRTSGETRKASGANVWSRTAENRADRELLELLLLLQQCMKEA